LTEAREFQDGEVIAGTRYRVLKLIGVGGMGSVYQVEHVELGKHFVLKSTAASAFGPG
jgi:serine/threonine protein kinase